MSRLTIYWEVPGGAALKVCRLDCKQRECVEPVECVTRLQCCYAPLNSLQSNQNRVDNECLCFAGMSFLNRADFVNVSNACDGERAARCPMKRRRALNDYEMGAVLRLMGVDLW